MEAPKTQSQKPIIVGILNIVAGVFNLIGIMGIGIAIVVIRLGQGYWANHYRMDNFVTGILIGCIIFLAITGILALAGGIYALNRKKRAWVIVGCIASIVSEPILGIPATVLVVISDKEYA